MKTMQASLQHRRMDPNTDHSVQAAPTVDATARIQRCLQENQICVLTFDRPSSQANLFDRATLEELDMHLRIIGADPRIKGLILSSAKPSIFIAGADIKALAETRDPEAIRDLIKLGQQVFHRLATLSIPTVAAIHGACVGGGYEVCLACDYRLASPEKSTRIGLPETLLGILPGWGGATRLPRLIGLPAALDIILAGKTLPAIVARKRGLVDELVPKENLLAVAQARILHQGTRLKARSIPLAKRVTRLRPIASLIRKKAHKAILRKTRGQYPAVLKALEVVTRGASLPLQRALQLEQDAVTELSQTTACRNLIQLFLLQEQAKKAVAGPAVEVPPVSRLAVIGAGIMGAGIAQWASSRNISVLLRDIAKDQLARGMANIAKLYQQALKRRAMTAVEARSGLDRITPCPTEVPLDRMELIIEAAVERMDLKRRIFASLDQATPPQTMLATNTSALSISEIAEATRHPERVVGIHFFNPVHRMQLVEIVQGRLTSRETLHRAIRFVQQIGKLPVVVQDRPGFLVNRILVPYLIEAGLLFEQGASVRDIDEAMLDFGMPMGPLRLIDEVGVDVARHVADTLVSHFPDRLSIPGVLDRLMEVGQLGRKSGHGFYLHHKGARDPEPHPGMERFQRGRNATYHSREALQERMVLLTVNEAARCLEEGVVATAAEVDFGMVMGTGFAPFRGGPLRWADAAGIAKIVQQMENLAQTDRPSFTPCNLLVQMAQEHQTFYQGDLP